MSCNNTPPSPTCSRPSGETHASSRPAASSAASRPARCAVVRLSRKSTNCQSGRTRACGSCGGVARRGQWRRGIDARFETMAFVVESVALGLQGLTLPVERDAPLRQTQAGLLLRRLQAMSRRIVAIQPDHPIGQRRKRCDTVVGADVQLLDAAEVTLPGLDQLTALLLDLRIGLLAALRRRLDGILSLVAGSAGIAAAGIPLPPARRNAAATPQSVRADRAPGCEARHRPCRKPVAPTPPDRRHRESPAGSRHARRPGLPLRRGWRSPDAGRSCGVLLAPCAAPPVRPPRCCVAVAAAPGRPRWWRPRAHACRALASFAAASSRLASCIVGSSRRVSSRVRSRVSASSAASWACCGAGFCDRGGFEPRLGFAARPAGAVELALGLA